MRTASIIIGSIVALALVAVAGLLLVPRAIVALRSVGKPPVTAPLPQPTTPMPAAAPPKRDFGAQAFDILTGGAALVDSLGLGSFFGDKDGEEDFAY